MGARAVGTPAGCGGGRGAGPGRRYVGSGGPPPPPPPLPIPWPVSLHGDLPEPATPCRAGGDRRLCRSAPAVSTSQPPAPGSRQYQSVASVGQPPAPVGRQPPAASASRSPVPVSHQYRRSAGSKARPAVAACVGRPAASADARSLFVEATHGGQPATALSAGRPWGRRRGAAITRDCRCPSNAPPPREDPGRRIRGGLSPSLRRL